MLPFASGPHRRAFSPPTSARRFGFARLRRLPCLLAALALWTLAAEPAQAALSWGISGGVTPLLVGQPNELARMGPASSLRLHWEDERQFDASIGWLHRAFRVSPDGRYPLGTHGIAVENGINFGWYRLGTSAELAWLQRFTPEATLQHDWGIVVETFVAVTLPGGEDERSKWELSLHLPALQNKPDALIQSRLMLTLWLK
jgi:hypothetical protein